jgi:predicted secreted protein
MAREIPARRTCFASRFNVRYAVSRYIRCEDAETRAEKHLRMILSEKPV